MLKGSFIAQFHIRLHEKSFVLSCPVFFYNLCISYVDTLFFAFLLFVLS